MRIFFDGSSKGNPGKGASGWIAHGKHETLFGWRYHERCTNNESEYGGLIDALRAVLSEPPGKLRVFGDSELVVKQMTGVYRVRTERLIPLFEEARSLVEDLEHKGWRVVISHVRRENNLLADYLSNAPFTTGKKGAVHRVPKVLSTVAELKLFTLI